MIGRLVSPGDLVYLTPCVMFFLQCTFQDDGVYFSALKDFFVPKFKPLDGVKIATTEAEAKDQGNGAIGGGALDDLDSQCDRLLKELPQPEDMMGFR